MDAAAEERAEAKPSRAIGAPRRGLPVGILTIVVVILLTKAPDKETHELVEHVRYPNLKAA